MSKTPPTQPLNTRLTPSELADSMQGAVDAIKALHEKLDKDWELRNQQPELSASAMPVDLPMTGPQEHLQRPPDTFNEPETEQDGLKAGEMRVARWRHQNRELARQSAEPRQTQTPPAEPQLIEVDSPFHHRLQEMPVDKMKELIRLRTRRGSEQTGLSQQNPTRLGKQPMEAAPAADDSARQPLVRGHHRYPVGGQMGMDAVGEPGAWLRRSPDESRSKWRHWLANLIAHLRGY